MSRWRRCSIKPSTWNERVKEFSTQFSRCSVETFFWKGPISCLVWVVSFWKFHHSLDALRDVQESPIPAPLTAFRSKGFFKRATGFSTTIRTFKTVGGSVRISKKTHGIDGFWRRKSQKPKSNEGNCQKAICQILSNAEKINWTTAMNFYLKS